MSLPRPITAVRWLAALYTFAMGFAAALSLGWMLLRDGGVKLPARAAPVTDASTETWLLLVWVVCAAYTGWRAMDREAVQP